MKSTKACLLAIHFWIALCRKPVGESTALALDLARSDEPTPGRVASLRPPGFRLVVMSCAGLALMTACTGSWGQPSRAPGSAVTPPGPNTGAQLHPSPVSIITRPEHDEAFDSGCALPNPILRRIRRGYYPGRSPDIFVVPRKPNFFADMETSTTHSGPWDYLQKVPLVFYGPGFIRPVGPVDLHRNITLADLSPTLAELLQTDPPQGTKGRTLRKILVPRHLRPKPPRLILTVVWDGGGWNVLKAWPHDWPMLASLMKDGASLSDVRVGSSPSVTPSIHATIGTGVFPKQHGISGIELRLPNGEVNVGAFRHRSPVLLKAPTLADVYDIATGNAAKIGLFAYKSWHLGMVGHGAAFPGGDSDLAIILNQQENPVTNTAYYSAPRYTGTLPGLASSLRRVDLDDGRLDSRWMGHEVLGDDPRQRRDTPAWVLYQTKIVKEIIHRENFGKDGVGDLFYTNFKQIDEVGHAWNLINPEMQSVLRYSDSVLASLRDFLDEEVGSHRWVMVVTADHGQGPDPRSVGAWPINDSELKADVARFVGVDVEDLVLNQSPVGLWLDESVMSRANISMTEVSNMLLDYRLADNVPRGSRIPEDYQVRGREPIFNAVFPSREIRRAWICARSS
jgi:Type I phosphodiesterase / nucleotide pyrophosphatase